MLTFVLMNDNWIRFAYWAAASNWELWREDFEFRGNIKGLPVLKNPTRYEQFLREYASLRGTARHEAETLKSWLLIHPNHLNKAIQSADGTGIDDLANHLRQEFPSLGGRQISFVSKLAVFARPGVFIAWDQYARKGVAKLTGGRRDGNYPSYCDYLKAVDTLWNGDLGRTIWAYIAKKPIPTRQRVAFALRVFDIYLMIQGGRAPWRQFLGD